MVKKKKMSEKYLLKHRYLITDKRYLIYTKELYGRIAKSVAKRLAKTRITPNQVTILSLFLGLISGLLFSFGYQIYLIIGIVLLQLSVFLDYLDGNLAREKNSMSAFGCWLDSFGDRIIDFFVFFGLAWGAFSITGNYLIWILCSLILGGHYLIVFNYLAVIVSIYEMRITKKIETSRFMKIFGYSRSNIYLLLVVFVLLNNILWYFYLMSIYSWLCYLGSVSFFTIKIKKYSESRKDST